GVGDGGQIDRRAPERHLDPEQNAGQKQPTDLAEAGLGPTHQRPDAQNRQREDESPEVGGLWTDLGNAGGDGREAEERSPDQRRQSRLRAPFRFVHLPEKRRNLPARKPPNGRPKSIFRAPIMVTRDSPASDQFSQILHPKNASRPPSPLTL